MASEDAPNTAPNELHPSSVPEGHHQISAEKPAVNGASESSEKQDDGKSKQKEEENSSGAQHNSDAGKGEKKEDKKEDKKKDGDDKPPPAGGYDAIPIPKRPQGWNLKITVHRASNLPMADINAFSSDPYVITEITSETPTRHKEDPPMRMRTKTIRKNVDPVWEMTWIVANVPSSGCSLKFRLYDEDPGDHDDRLGNVHLHINSLHEGWEAIKERAYKIEKRAGSKRAYAVRAFATCFRIAKEMRGELVLSVELLGRTPEDGQSGRLYTVGPSWWIRHYSPLLGRIANTHEPDEDKKNQETDEKPETQSNGEKQKSETRRYDFQANQIQLSGPVPPELYHRFVEFKPWVQRMFTGSGLKGMLLSKALHHQHDRVYHFDRLTKWGELPPNPGADLTKKFLELVHYDQGARIFTYVLTLDALWRFTETGKEFGIDMLSKHTMHSDVNIYIAFSGEFFIRRVKYPKQPPPPEPTEETSQSHPPEHQENPTHPPEDVSGGPPDDDPPKDPSHYQLIIDNDSGTYRPNAKMLPILKKFLSRNLPGLHIMMLDCQEDEEKMGKMKNEQRERKKQEGQGAVYMQGNDASSISSSDEEDLDALQAGFSGGKAEKEQGTFKQTARDVKLRNHGKVDKAKAMYYGRENADGEVADDGSSTAEGAGEAATVEK